MWIRRQDKELLGNFKAFYIDEHMSDEIVIIGCDGHVHVNDKVLSAFELGTYKSKERALEVLDEIQKLLIALPRTEIPFNDVVYQMPEE